ncbi:PX domain-containing protein [Fulvia fulva]|uniref:PX domain-containing protein n=1 Tax=Passalora fulva TaxID=5499 RepID=A0A9Q8L6N4_PASFU|nr:PX domain-containing protein [Fulvia fulva]KAK4636154.1 PX domain-containing protein [Fulvia fulva]KAK4638158.1 PX domain-containing protein [Fulvia fulva]UJO11808.1 PX domain-containing protein [Fulvia fulva]WPV09531.1 PX domain-containing protein [Fulvia fulva]WPV24918.1 PX domain-containing protein [Fulvia fulva]
MTVEHLLLPMATQLNGGPKEEATAPVAPTPFVTRSKTVESQAFVDAPETQDEQAAAAQARRTRLLRSPTQGTMTSTASVPPPGSLLTGKQEHYLKRELISAQTQWEVSELSHPTALQRFGAPFRSDRGEVAPEHSELPLLRYIFVHHVRNFPFLNQAKEKEFWQDKLQAFLESFANKHISSAEDRLEQTKRAKLAQKANKLVELMMVSGIPTASGYEERIRFSEMEVVESGPNEEGLVVNVPEGHEINGWDINVAGVRLVSVKRHVRQHKHAEFLLRVKRRDEPERYVARRFGEFARMHKKLRLELPGKVLPPLPKKNKAQSLYSGKDDDDDSDSVSSMSTTGTGTPTTAEASESNGSGGGFRSYLSSWTGGGSTSTRHGRNASKASLAAPSASPRASMDSSADKASQSPLRTACPQDTVLHREDQRVSLRAFLRNFLQNEAIANSKSMYDFLTAQPITLNDEERADIDKRKHMDSKRLEEQRQFFEIARQRARDLDVHMEKFRRSVVEANGLRNLFAEIKQKEKIDDLNPEFRKFAEWLRIEVAATTYHLFLAEDNSPELFAQAKRIHGLVPYSALKQVIRFTNPAAVMSSVLDLFMAQPLGAKSLLQRIFGLALGDGIRSLQRSIDSLTVKIDEPALCDKIKNYIEGIEDVRDNVRTQAREEQVDLLVKVLQSDEIEPQLSSKQIERVFNAYVAWDNAVENVDEEMRQGAELFARLKQLLKLHTRRRDKQMMLELVEESNTLRLFRDLFQIFYEPLVRVYKSANVYNSVTDFARFADDAIQTIEKAQRQDVSADPNQTVQSFIDLCERHEEDLYKFIHEVHKHDNGLFDKLMAWIEGILDFLRNGPKGGKLDMNALFAGALEIKQIDKDKALKEINSLIKWQTARKRWHSDKTRQKMASGGNENADVMGGLASTFKPGDFGLNPIDLQDLNMEDDEDFDSEEEDDEDDADPIAAERKRRQRRQDVLKRTAGEPVKPEITELHKMNPQFLSMLRMVLAE